MDSIDSLRCIETQRSSEDHWLLRFVGEPEAWFQSIRAGGVTKYVASNANGGGKATPIRKGKPFSSRLQGGGERSQIFGTWEYGSGYPDSVGRGVQGRGFPFYFWPVVWAGNAVSKDDQYLHTAAEYGLPTNDERPGGLLTKTALVSNSTGNIYRILTDNATAGELLRQVERRCSSFFNLSFTVPATYPWAPAVPFPEQAIQYYRASSIALTFDGYNNTAALSVSVSDTVPFLGTNISDPLLACLNTTIGCTALLVTKSEPVGGLVILWHVIVLWFLVAILCGVALVGGLLIVTFLLWGIYNSLGLLAQKLNPGTSHSLTPDVITNVVDKTSRVSISSQQVPESSSELRSQSSNGNQIGVQRDSETDSRRSWDTETRVGDDEEFLLQEQGSGSRA